jgi:hypothetical protein
MGEARKGDYHYSSAVAAAIERRPRWAGRGEGASARCARASTPAITVFTAHQGTIALATALRPPATRHLFHRLVRHYLVNGIPGSLHILRAR